MSRFILILYYCSRISSGSSMITILINRWGDIGIVLFILWWGVSGLIVNETSFGWNFQRVVCWFLVLCVISKSAQFPIRG